MQEFYHFNSDIMRKKLFYGHFMRKIAILFLLATLLYGNPKIYSALGDVVYDNVQIIKELKNITEFKEYESKIDEYVKNIFLAKEKGFSLDSDTYEIEKKEYLEILRELSKTNDFFFKYALKIYKNSIEKQNTLLWNKMINSGLIDVQKYKNEIIEFYFTHIQEIDAKGVIQNFIDDDKNLKAKYNKSSSFIKIETQEERIENIREEHRTKQEAIQKNLEEELKKK